MNQTEFKGLLDRKGYLYTVDKSQIIVTHQRGVNLRSVTSLPDNVTFKNYGGVYLRSVTSLPDNVTFKNYGSVDLESVTSLSDNITFKNYGSVDLESVTSLPSNITFKNHGYVYLKSVTSLPDNVKFNNYGGVDLESVKSLPANITFNNHGWVDLESVTSLPVNIIFNNHGGVYLEKVTSLPDNVTFNNYGGVYLENLKGKHKYKGKEFEFMHVDGSTMLIESSKKKGDILIHKARYFGGGDIDKLKKCFVAQKGNYYAHGETVKNAIEDVNFKFLQETFNTDDLVNQIKESGIVTKNDYRLLTGACSLGCDMFIKEHGISDSISLKKAKSLIHNVYGSDQFNELFAE